MGAESPCSALALEVGYPEALLYGGYSVVGCKAGIWAPRNDSDFPKAIIELDSTGGVLSGYLSFFEDHIREQRVD